MTEQAIIKQLDVLEADLRALERQCAQEGGFLTSDWRALRMRSLGEEIDQLEERLHDLDPARW